MLQSEENKKISGKSSKGSGAGLTTSHPRISSHTRTTFSSTPQSNPVKQSSLASKPVNNTVSLRRGDTLWEIAQKKLGNGSRWQELRKADGSRFKPQEVRHLQVGTLVSVPWTKPTTTKSHHVNSFSQIHHLNSESKGITRREFTSGSTHTSRTSLPSASPTYFSRTSQVSANLLGAGGTTRHQDPNESSHSARSTRSQDSSDAWSNNALINGTVKGIAVGNFVNKSLLSAANAKVKVTRAKDVVRLVGRPLSRGDINLLQEFSHNHKVSKQLQDISRQLEHKVTGSQISTSDLARVLKANNWQKETIFELRRGGYQKAAKEAKRTRIPLTRTTSITIVHGGKGNRNLSKTQLWRNVNKDAEVRISRERKVGLPKRRPGWHQYARVQNPKSN
ncbi:hypothetical protein LC608_36065 [Nostoc sp. XA010]|uniref:LysM peptidoglycan-binding domain-containing protein n=1 Tax=Nostoc sp. XA010 TaxID=2780407 RepID=UPI001E2B35C7|nr:hypothetical protein [Nostoc sp. XA010]MCC5662232.1 hypothetical protein [Nostoc sp. XA010]